MTSYLNSYGLWSDNEKAKIIESHITTYYRRKEKWKYKEAVSPLIFFMVWEDSLTVTNINLAIEKLKASNSFTNLNNNGIELFFNEMSLFINTEEAVSKTRTVLNAILKYKLKNKYI